MSSLKNSLAPKSIHDHYDTKLVKFAVDQLHDLPHFLFWGSPGTGKTEFAHLLAHEFLGHAMGLNFHEFNSSQDRGIDFIRGPIAEIAMSSSMAGNRKIIYLGEADGLTKDAQSALRRLMEIGNAIFIFSCNYPNKLIDAIHNRCSVWEFKGPSVEWVIERAKQCNDVDMGILEKTLASSAPSFRSIFDNYHKLSSGVPILNEEKTLISMSIKDFIEVTKTQDYNIILNTLHREILELKSPFKGQLLLELAEIDYRCSQQCTKQLQLQSGFLRLFKIVNAKKEEKK